MLKFVTAISRILDTSDNVHFIISPIYKLLRMGLLFFVVKLLLFFFSFSYAIIFTIPIFLFESYFYYMFCKLWKAYRYSSFYLVLNPLLALFLALFLKVVMNNL